MRRTNGREWERDRQAGREGMWERGKRSVIEEMNVESIEARQDFEIKMKRISVNPETGTQDVPGFGTKICSHTSLFSSIFHPKLPYFPSLHYLCTWHHVKGWHLPIMSHHKGKNKKEERENKALIMLSHKLDHQQDILSIAKHVSFSHPLMKCRTLGNGSEPEVYQNKTHCFHCYTPFVGFGLSPEQ